MIIASRVNSSVLTNDLEQHKTNWFKHHDLSKRIDKGELFAFDIETKKEQKEFTVFTKEYYSAIKIWYDNFESLWFNRFPKIEIDKKDIEYLRNKYQYSTPLTKEIKEKINIDNDILHWLAYFIKNIYLQPVYYYDAIIKYPDTLTEIEKAVKRYDYISGKCNIVKSKFEGLAYSEINTIIKNLINDDAETSKLLKRIFLFVESFLFSLPYDWFIYIESPVFIDFINTMQKLKQYYDFNTDNKGLPKFNDCVKNISEYKAKFELPEFMINDIEHYKKTKKTPFTGAFIPVFKDRNKFESDKEKYNDKLLRYTNLIQSIEDKEKSNIEINDTIDVFNRIINKTEISNYKEYFSYLIEQLQNLKKNNQYLENNSPYPQLFSDYDYKLFIYLNNEYTIGNNSLRAKYSYIYHFLKYESKLSGTQLEYIAFIKKEYDIIMSKILSKDNVKYNKEIQPLLTRLHSNFKQQNNN